MEAVIWRGLYSGLLYQVRGRNRRTANRCAWNPAHPHPLHPLQGFLLDAARQQQEKWTLLQGFSWRREILQPNLWEPAGPKSRLSPIAGEMSLHPLTYPPPFLLPDPFLC
ncbi:hypothetical protein AAFF_G00071640 [Aldrovandia affinis]|uniref:Uncharacterized protein n=1 Tax=Aldrovandia affinis TaxID=143900 RepID=A0AAD7RZC6_9TELE|nr:hypothetical protein AAFF_G00071640 [Aldrovandia affinis]